MCDEKNMHKTCQIKLSFNFLHVPPTLFKLTLTVLRLQQKKWSAGPWLVPFSPSLSCNGHSPHGGSLPSSPVEGLFKCINFHLYVQSTSQLIVPWLLLQVSATQSCHGSYLNLAHCEVNNSDKNPSSRAMKHVVLWPSERQISKV